MTTTCGENILSVSGGTSN